jgi:hypothetical protein
MVAGGIIRFLTFLNIIGNYLVPKAWSKLEEASHRGLRIVCMNKVSLHLAFSLGNNLVFTSSDPLTLALRSYLIRSGLRNVNAAANPIAFHSAGCVHGITKELEAPFRASKDTSSHRARVETNSHLQFGGLSTELVDEFVFELIEFYHAVSSEPDHNDSMIILWLRKTSGSNVAISDGLDFEDTPFKSNGVKGTVKCLEKIEDLGRSFARALLCKARQVRK